MALDGIAAAHLVRELKDKLAGGRIDKIHQPEPDEIILAIKNNISYKLLISAGAQAPRAHITGIAKDNPMNAPLFCMVLRKHLMGGRILDITQQAGFERVIIIEVQAVNEMGEICGRRLVVEIMGKHSNIILLDDKDMILDAVKRITFEISSHREVLPGRAYISPPVQDKADITAVLNDYSMFRTRLTASEGAVHKRLYGAFTGISPSSAKEMLHRAGVDMDTPVETLDENNIKHIYDKMRGITEDALFGRFKGELAVNGKGTAVDFAPYEMTVHPPELRQKAHSMSELLEDFYGKKDHAHRIAQKSQDLRRLVSQNIERCVRKYDTHQKTLAEVENRDTHRLYGELLTSNLYQIPQGAAEVTVQNYYDENGGNVVIKLDARLTPVENAQRYYKRYNKDKRAFEALRVQMEQNKEELDYLEGVMASLLNAESETELNEIREELTETGFARRRNASKEGKRKAAASVPLSFMSSDGFTFFVGKNNRQNDELTMKNAAPEDIFLHAKNIPGSHVIIKANSGSVPNRTIEEAAGAAAYYCKAKDSALVPVDYTLRKYVKKPTGAKPGMVIYTHQKTAFVRPGLVNEKHTD